MDVDPRKQDLGEVYFTPQNKVDAIISMQGSTSATLNQDCYTGVASTSTTSRDLHVPSSNLSKKHWLESGNLKSSGSKSAAELETCSG